MNSNLMPIKKSQKNFHTMIKQDINKIDMIKMNKINKVKSKINSRKKYVYIVTLVYKFNLSK